jgi:RHS repeat-associated protein
VDCVFGFTGRPLSVLSVNAATGGEDGLQFNGGAGQVGRWYDAITGRWLSEDHVWSGTNLYRYCGDSPTNAVDPTGLEPRPPQIVQSVTPYVVVYMSSMYGGLGWHTVIVAGGDGEYHVYEEWGDGQGHMRVLKQNWRPYYGTRVAYPVYGKFVTPEGALSELDKQFNQMHPPPYKWSGPNCNTFTHQLLKNAGCELAPQPGNFETMFDVATPRQSSGWNDPSYGGDRYDKYGNPKK